MPDPKTRRDVVQSIVTAPFAWTSRHGETTKAGWFDGSDSAPVANISELLSKFQFTGQDGGSVKAALQSLKGKPATLSFAWLGCSDAHASMHETLSGLGKLAPELVHVVVDVNPALDNLDNATRGSLLQELRQKGKLSNNVIMLYPDPADIDRIQEAMPLIPIHPPQNIVAVGLYGRDGKKIGIKSTAQNSPEAIINEWREPLANSKER